MQIVRLTRGGRKAGRWHGTERVKGCHEDGVLKKCGLVECITTPDGKSEMTRRIEKGKRRTHDGVGRVDLDRRHDAAHELEEDDEVLIDPESLRSLLVPLLHRRRRRTLVLAPTGLELAREPSSRLLALASLGLDDARVHALDDLLHHARVLARVHRGHREGRVGEGLDRDRLLGVVGRDVLECGRGREGALVL